MIGFITGMHALICVILVAVILMQSGRGGGLTEAFASAESMFGAQTNAFMIKVTTIISVIFLVTCLSLAVLSAKKGKSLMRSPVLSEPQTVKDGVDVDTAVDSSIPVSVTATEDSPETSSQLAQ